MLREALRAPATGEDALALLALGGGCHLLAEAVPVVPFVLVAGLLVRTLGHAAGSREPPRFAPGRLPGVAREGLGAALVAGCFLVVPVAVLAATTGLAGRGGGPSALVVTLGGTAALAAAAPFLYLLPAGLAGYAVEGRLRAAFDRRRLRRAAGDARYLVATLASAGGLGVAAALYGPLRPVVAGFFLAFYAERAAATLCGRAVAAAGAGAAASGTEGM
jgi:hypothetical protein